MVIGQWVLLAASIILFGLGIRWSVTAWWLTRTAVVGEKRLLKEIETKDKTLTDLFRAHARGEAMPHFPKNVEVVSSDEKLAAVIRLQRDRALSHTVTAAACFAAAALFAAWLAIWLQLTAC